MEKLNYEEDVRIDPEALDVEWLKQAELMKKYAIHAADTKKEMDEIKEQIDVTKARIEMNIRKEPEKYNLPKVTEGAIQSTIILQEEYQELVQEYTEAKYENDVAIAAVRAIDQKKTALENLVRLLSASYFAGPQAPRDLSGEWLKERERKEENARIKIQRRRMVERNGK
jgi:hypothetical protein